MSKHVSPHFWRVTWNGKILRQGFRSKVEAFAMAERWQGQHGGGSRGLLKHKDLRDYIEVSRDHITERDWDDRVDAAKRYCPQVIHYEQRVE